MEIWWHWSYNDKLMRKLFFSSFTYKFTTFFYLQDESKLYIFLELVTKGSLASVYRKYRLRDSHVSDYTRQILSGLHYLHSRNVIHRWYIRSLYIADLWSLRAVTSVLILCWDVCMRTYLSIARRPFSHQSSYHVSK